MKLDAEHGHDARHRRARLGHAGSRRRELQRLVDRVADVVARLDSGDVDLAGVVDQRLASGIADALEAMSVTPPSGV